MTGAIYTAMDACINRAIEGLRVCEDIFRFVLHHPASSEFKILRHSIRDAVSALPVSRLLDSRDIVSDSQKFFDTAGESDRHGLAGVFRSNIRRAAEAVRSLEELSKIDDPAAGALFQSIRFRIYEVEKSCWFILQRAGLSERIRKSSCAVIDVTPAGLEHIAGIASEAIASGAGIILLKHGVVDDGTKLEVTRRVASMCNERDVLCFVYGRPDIALLAGAHGLCLDAADIPVGDARKITGENMLIGISAYDGFSEGDAQNFGADFILLNESDSSVKLKFFNLIID